MPYTDSSVDNLIFNVMDSEQYQSLVNAGTVEENELYLITDGLDPVIQTTTNLVTSISSSSTNTQYPSAKAVYDALPTATSDLTNDSGFITLSDVPDPATIRRFTAPWSSGYIVPTSYAEYLDDHLTDPTACYQTVEASYASGASYTQYVPVEDMSGSVLYIFSTTSLNYPVKDVGDSTSEYKCTLRVRATAGWSESSYYDAATEYISEQILLGNTISGTVVGALKYADYPVYWTFGEPDIWKQIGNEVNTWSITLTKAELVAQPLSVKFEFGDNLGLVPAIYAIDCVIEEVVS